MGKGDKPRPMTKEARKRAEDNWCEIRENDRLLDAWCAKEGICRKDLGYHERALALKKARDGGL